MTEDQQRPQHAEIEVLAAEPPVAGPPRRPGLTARDWAAVIGLVLAAALSLGVTISHWAQAGPAANPTLLLSIIIDAALMALTGALLAYIAQRPRLETMRQTAEGLGGIAHEMIGIYQEMRRLVEAAYHAGTSDGQAGYQEVLEELDESQARADELERLLAAHQAGLPIGPDLSTLTKQVAELARMIAETQQMSGDLERDTDEAEQRIAELHAQATAVTEELAHLQARQMPLDAIDQQILALLTEDPSTTDDEISRHPKVKLDRSQVTRRRNRLAAAGYRAAQKRQGQRPRAR